MNEEPCSHLVHGSPRCYLGWNTRLDCTGCCSYDPHPDPALAHWVTWHEIRNGVGTRTDGDNTNQAGQRGAGE